MNIKYYLNKTIEECDSTNDIGKTLGLRGCPHGSWISSKKQLRGRGRAGRRWVSLEENIFLSVVVRPGSDVVLTWIPLVAATLVCDVLYRAFPSLDPKIKWPNDIFVKNKKLAGILCEGYQIKNDPFVVVGLGLNSSGSPPELVETTDLYEQLGFKVDIDRLRMELVESFSRGLRDLENSNWKSFRDEYAKFSFLNGGDEICWNTSNVEKSGYLLNIGENGELIVENKASGIVESLVAEEVRLRVRRIR